MTQTLVPQEHLSPDIRLYERVVGRILELIDGGTLRPGQRLPSVRKLSRQMRISISTVLQAYRILEDAGRIKAKPQSGYYVSVRAYRAPAEPEMSRPTVESTSVRVSDQVMRLLEATRHRDIIPLGAAVAGADALPVRKLNAILRSVIRRQPTLGHSYDVPPGCEALRVAVARRAMEAGCTLTPDDLLTTTGSQEAIGLCLRAVAKPGDTIAIESPTYYGILQTIEGLGMKALEIPTHPRDGVSLDALRLALDETNVKACVFATNFSNPLGSVMPDDSKRRLVEMLAERQIPLIEDDVYGDLHFDEVRPKVCKAFDERGLVLLCSSFSKTLAAGYRVGWCAPGRWQQEVARLKFQSTIASASAPQAAVAEFLETGGYDHHLRSVRRFYHQQVDRMKQAICEFFPEDTKATRPAGGFVLWVQLPGRVDSMALHDRALAEKISIAPGPIFSAKQKYRDFIRLNCGIGWSAEIERAMARLGQMVREMSCRNTPEGS